MVSLASAAALVSRALALFPALVVSPLLEAFPASEVFRLLAFSAFRPVWRASFASPFPVEMQPTVVAVAGNTVAGVPSDLCRNLPHLPAASS